MKITVHRPTEIEVTHVVIDVPVHDDEESVAAGDFPFLAKTGEEYRWKAKVEVDSGQIVDWPDNAGTRHFHAWPRDGGTYTLLGPDGKEVAKLEEQPVPNALVPGEYRDSVDLEIDHKGRIANWPRKPQFHEFFGREET